MSLFRGLLGYPITPADASGRVDAEALGALVDGLAEAGVDGIGLLGSTGSYMFLERDERRRAVRAAVASAAGRVPVTVGIGALRTDAVQALARDAEEEGAAGLLLAPVSYTPLLPEEVLAHVRAVADSTRLPICIYDNPTTTGFSFDDALLAALGTLPTVAAIKRPAPAAQVEPWLTQQRKLFPARCAVGCSVDWHAVSALQAGADGWHSVLGGVLPRPCLALTRAAQDGNASEARRLDETLAPIWSLFRDWSSIRIVHAMADRMGVPNAILPSPIRPLPAEALYRIAAVLETLEA